MSAILESALDDERRMAVARHDAAMIAAAFPLRRSRSGSRSCTEYIQTGIAGARGELEVEVSYDFDPADPGCVERGTGLALSPSYAARVKVTEVKCGKVDLLPVLDADQVRALELSILREVEEVAA